MDLTEARVHLRDPEDFTRFSVVVDGVGDLGRWWTGPGSAGSGRTGRTWWSIRSPFARWPGPPPTAEWDEGLAGMVAYAAGRGWVENDGGVVAHVEGRDEAG